MLDCCYSFTDCGQNRYNFYSFILYDHVFRHEWVFFMCRGYRHFLKRSELETSSYLKRDCLILCCTIGVVMKTRNKRPQEFSVSVPPSDLGHCFKGFLDSGIASDIIFEIKGETFKAHKQILAARSPVFQAQFFGPIGNPNLHKVVVKDIAPPVFKV